MAEKALTTVIQEAYIHGMTTRSVGMDIGPSEAENFWTELVRILTRRVLRGAKLVISDAHAGLKAAVTCVLNATWQRCRVLFMRNPLAHSGRNGRRLPAAFVDTIFAQETKAAARQQWRNVVNQLAPSLPKVAVFMGEAEEGVMAYMPFPQHTG